MNWKNVYIYIEWLYILYGSNILVDDKISCMCKQNAAAGIFFFFCWNKIQPLQNVQLYKCIETFFVVVYMMLMPNPISKIYTHTDTSQIKKSHILHLSLSEPTGTTVSKSLFFFLYEWLIFGYFFFLFLHTS